MSKRTKFKGWAGRTNKGTPCWVRNESTGDDGRKLYKVRLGRVVGYYDSGFEFNEAGEVTADIAYDGRIGWMDARNVQRAG